MNFFEELHIGERDELGSHTFTAEQIKTFARAYDPQLFHLDERAAAQSHFGALCASGWHTAAMYMRHLVDHWSRLEAERRARGEDVAESGPSPGVRDLRWPKPVYAGDIVSFAHEIIELRDGTKQPGWGMAVSRNTGTNQHGQLVLSFLGAKFVRRRQA
jgi:acyl dehydratase